MVETIHGIFFDASFEFSTSQAHNKNCINMTYVHFSSDQVSGTEMSKWLNELCPIILDMLQDASLIAKREVSGLLQITTYSTVLKLGL